MRPHTRAQQGCGNLKKIAAAPQTVTTTLKVCLYSKHAGQPHYSRKIAGTSRTSEGDGMDTYFTISDFVLIIPMALAGALFVGALPCKTEFRHNLFRIIGALMGVGVAVLLVEGLPALV
jgi:hypothetical protein